MKTKFLAGGLCAAITCTIALSGCAQPDEPNKDKYFFNTPQTYEEYLLTESDAMEVSGFIMGTQASLRIIDEQGFVGANGRERYAAATEVWQKACDVLVTVNSSISATVETSYISAFNRAGAGEEVELDQTAYEILSLAKTVYELTDGYYNPAVYQSLELFGFAADNNKPKLSALPAAADVSAFKELSGYFSNVELTQKDGKYYATKPAQTVLCGGVNHSLKIDLGGIGKGWCADKIDGLISEAGFECGLFGFGSSSIALKKFSGDGEGDTFGLSVRDPRNILGGYCKIRTKDVKLSTSGDYERYYELDGIRYCHIIDPTTGCPIRTGVASVTVIGGTAAEDDALTTALSAMGKQRAVQFINEHLSDRKVIMLVFEDGTGKIITNCPDEISVLNTQYAVANTVDADGKIVL